MKLTVAQARQVLKVDGDATPEEVKAAYKRAALATHPDRNLDNENATLEFQRVGTAYSVLEKYGNKDEPRGFSSPFDSSFNDGGGFGFSFRGPGASYARDEYDEEDDDEEGEQGGAEFFEFMFQSMFSGGGGGGRGPRFSFGGAPPPRRYNQTQARADIAREDAADAEWKRVYNLPENIQARKEEKRRQDEDWRRARLSREQREHEERVQKEMEKQRDSKDAIFRREKKNEERKKKLEKERLASAARVADRLAQVQIRRSAVFGSARAGRAEDVRKGVWEDNVVASDVEILVTVVEGEESEEKTEDAPAPRSNGGGKGRTPSRNAGSTAEDKVEDKENVNLAPAPGTGGGSKGGKGRKGKEACKVVVEEPAEEKENVDINGGEEEKGAGTSKAAKARKRRAAKAAAKKAGAQGELVEEEVAVEDGVGSGGKNDKEEAKARAKALHASKTLLILAVETGDTDLAIWLIDHGASPDERDSERYTAFHHALRLGNLALIEYFISNYDVRTDDMSSPPPPHETLLSLAVTSGSPEAVSLVVPFSAAEDAQANWEWIERNLGDKTRRSAEEVAVWEKVKWALTACEGFAAPAGYRRRKMK